MQCNKISFQLTNVTMGYKSNWKTLTTCARALAEKASVKVWSKSNENVGVVHRTNSLHPPSTEITQSIKIFILENLLK